MKRMSSLKFWTTVLSLLLVRFCDNKNCSLRLIQPLDQSSGLSYVIVTPVTAFMVGVNGSYSEVDLPEKFKEPTGVLVYINKDCSTPQNSLLVYKYLEFNGELKPSVRTLDLNDWTPNKVNDWGKTEEMAFLKTEEGFVNLYQINFSMLWIKQKRLYIIQTDRSNPIVGTKDYRVLKIGTEDDPCGYQKFLHPEKNILEILQPWEEFESCFVEKEQNIVCFGPNGFTSFPIDLKETNDTNLRVGKGTTVNSTQIPILQTIEEISNRCFVSTPEPTEASTSQKPDTKFSAIVWIIVVLLLLGVIILVLCLCYCLKKSTDQKESGSDLSSRSGAPIDDQKTDKSSKSKLEQIKSSEALSSVRSKLERKDTTKNKSPVKGKDMLAKSDSQMTGTGTIRSGSIKSSTKN